MERSKEKLRSRSRPPAPGFEKAKASMPENKGESRPLGGANVKVLSDMERICADKVRQVASGARCGSQSEEDTGLNDLVTPPRPTNNPKTVSSSFNQSCSQKLTIYEAKESYFNYLANEFRVEVGDLLSGQIGQQNCTIANHDEILVKNIRTGKIGLCPKRALKILEKGDIVDNKDNNLQREARNERSTIAKDTVKVLDSPKLQPAEAQPVPVKAEAVATRPVSPPAPPPRTYKRLTPPPPPPPLSLERTEHTLNHVNRSAQGSSPKELLQPVQNHSCSNYRQEGLAMDIVGVRSTEGSKIYATEFIVRFGIEDDWTTDVHQKVSVLINGKSHFYMTLRNGEGLFPDGGLFCDPSVLGSIDSLGEGNGCHTIRFEASGSRNGQPYVWFVEASMWIWNADATVVVSDVDGTITKTDVRGMLQSIVGFKMGFKQGYAHPGLCFMYQAVQRHTGANFLYLTARPLSLIQETREYLSKLTQADGYSLPRGPVLTNKSGLGDTFKREIFLKTTHIFKAKLLERIVACFQSACRDNNARQIFLACFGNHDSDVAAYLMGGAHPSTTFKINQSSSISTAEDDCFSNFSLSEPKFIEMMLSRLDSISLRK